MENEYDIELYEYVKSSNDRAGRIVARVVEDIGPAFIKLKSWIPRLKPRGNIDWGQAITSSAPLNSSTESLTEKSDRIANDFRLFLEHAKLTNLDWITFLSDDFYSKGIECETNLGEDLLSRWLEVPHGIFIVENIHPALHYISLARTSYVFAQQ